MQREDKIRILHILDGCETVARFVEGRERSALDSDEMLRFALVRAIEVIGEAATRVSPSARAELSDIPWTQISSMRNRLIHAYFEVDHDIVWQTAIADIPDLHQALRYLRD